jgi:hypothetical protein
MMEAQDVTSIPDEVPVNLAVPKPRRTKLIVGVVVLVVVLAGAAFVGGRLLNQQPQAAGPGGITLSGGPAGGQSISLQIERAKELPDAAPDVTGLFAERKDNSIFVTMGGGKFTVQVDKDGTVNTQTDGNGQKLEVVVTSETTVYKDVTQPPEPNALPSDGKIQQKVAPGSLDEIGSNSSVTAWGERRGDRLIAKVLFYSRPFMFKAPAP